ncbi:MAG: ABC transporter permease, partial [Cyclobacteriaceae bacterium]
GVVYQQLNFVQNKDLGFQKDHIMLLPSTDEIYDRFSDVRMQLMDQPGILDVTLSSRVPSGRLLDSQGGEYEIGGGMKQIDIRVADIHVDFDYMRTFEIDIIAGRDFDAQRASDSLQAFILNKAAVEALGYTSPEDAVGKSFHYGGRQGEVIGVTEDFHFESLHQSIAPIVFMITSGRARVLSVKYDPDRKDEVVSFLREQWSYFRPGFPFSYQEVAQAYDEQYSNERRLARLITTFSIMAIVIAAMGLFGLATFVASRRRKEMGIRKVMGASVSELLVLRARNFTLLVGIAFLLAVPVAYFGMNEWLDEFAYRLDLNIWPFLIGGLVALLIAWVTISYQTLKAARTNPVDSLRQD